MKKTIALILCLVLAASLSVTAFADAGIRVVNGTHTVGDGMYVCFIFSGIEKADYSYTLMDGERINAGIQSNEKGQVFIALKPEYTDTLKAGEHTVQFVFGSTTLESKFTVVAAYNPYGNPQTGDSSDIALWSVLAIMACGAAAVLGKKVYGK